VLGFVTNMADWMRAADILLTKAGPNTIMEAVHCGLPLVLTGALPGQEEGNIAFVTSRGLGQLAQTPAEIVKAVARLLDDEPLVARIKEAMQDMRCPQAAGAVAQLILSTCRETSPDSPSSRRQRGKQ